MLPFKPCLCSCEECWCISNFLSTRDCRHNLLAGARAAEKRTKGRACGGGGGKSISAVKHSSAVTRGGWQQTLSWEGRGALLGAGTAPAQGERCLLLPALSWPCPPVPSSHPSNPSSHFRAAHPAPFQSLLQPKLQLMLEKENIQWLQLV